MQRSIWHGAISFGLIYVPVDVVSASKDASLSLHFLDSRDFSPVGYQRINKSTGKEVDWAHIVKGYEYEKGHYVALSDADFKRLCVFPQWTRIVVFPGCTKAARIYILF